RPKDVHGASCEPAAPCGPCSDEAASPRDRPDTALRGRCLASPVPSCSRARPEHDAAFRDALRYELAPLGPRIGRQTRALRALGFIAPGPRFDLDRREGYESKEGDENGLLDRDARPPPRADSVLP